MALIKPGSIRKAVDLGCGTGDLTRILHEEFSIESMIGTDNSRTMLSQAEKKIGTGVTFRLQDIEEFSGAQEYDLVFANASFQWCDDHPSLFGKCFRSLKPNGQFAVQMPANYDYPTHTIAAALANEEPYRSQMKNGVRSAPVAQPSTYAELLFRTGFKEQSVRLQVYAHVLESREEVIEWVKGTLFTYYESNLPPELYSQFIVEYQKRLFQSLANEKPFFYPFKRILIWARK